MSPEPHRATRTGRSSAAVDLVVIGAGVNGAAVAREGTLRGLRTMLVDERDIAAGTSAASSRMIHGGPRYLEHGELRLVRESLRERERLLRSAPHLVVPYPLLIPFYEHNRRGRATLRTGMVLYDALSPDKRTPRHRILPAAEVRRRCPGLQTRGLRGAALYYDAHAFLAERLAVEQALDVEAAGGQVLTHAGVGAIDAGTSAIELELVHALHARTEVVRARAVVNAAGPWVDAVLDRAGRAPHRRLIGAVKGSHLTLDAFPGAPSTGGIHYEARSDGRPILVLPQADGHVLVGSTEVVEECDPAALRCSDEEMAYLLSELNELIPGAGVNAGDVLHSYAGARPLPYDPGARTPASVSRDHHVVAHHEVSGLFSLTGGKLTTHRALGERAIDRVLAHLGAPGPRRGTARPVPGSGPRRLTAARHRAGAVSPTRSLPLPGGRTHAWTAFAAAMLADGDVAPSIVRRLLSVYGVRAAAVLELAAGDPRLGRVIPGTGDVLAAEVALAFDSEFAQTLVDVLARRLMLARRADGGLHTAPAVADACAVIAGWDGERTRRELLGYRRWSECLRPRAAMAGGVCATDERTGAATAEVGGR